MQFLVLLPMVWLAVLTVILGLCISSARGDRALVAAGRRRHLQPLC